MPVSVKLERPASEKRILETLCAWCGRFKNPDGSWGFPTSFRSSRECTHGICPQCAAKALKRE